MIFLPNSDHSYHSARIRVECPGQGKVLPKSPNNTGSNTTPTFQTTSTYQTTTFSTPFWISRTRADGTTIQDQAEQDRWLKRRRQCNHRERATIVPTVTKNHILNMSEQQENPQNRNNNETLRLLQINLNKSEKAHLDIINENLSRDYDLILIQEPYTTTFNAIRTPTNFRPVFPRS